MISRDDENSAPGDASETMRYAMLGKDDSSTREKLEKFTGVVGWSYLKPHFQSGVLLYVDPALDLTSVGEAFAQDRRESVETWMKSGDLVKPSDPHAAYWEEAEAQFTALVVSPFVLIQPAATDQEKDTNQAGS